MRYLIQIVAALIFGTATVGSAFSPTAQAQMTVFHPSYAPVVVTPPVPLVAVPLAPATVYRPAIVAAPVPYGVARPVIVNSPIYAARPVVAPPLVAVAPPVTVARPVVPTSVVIPAAVPRSLYRPAVVGPGVGGLPNVYVPGQPVRNALRFALP